MKNNQKIEIFAGQKAPDSNLGMLWLDESSAIPYLKIVNKNGTTNIVGGPALELSTSMTEVSTGKAADSTVVKTLNDSISSLEQDISSIDLSSKYPTIGNAGPGTATMSVVQSMAAMGFSLTGAKLINADLTGIDLNGLNLNQCVFTGADLESANLTSCQLEGAKFDGAILSLADLTYSYLKDVDFSGATMATTVMTGTYLGENDFTGATVADPDINIAMTAYGVNGISGNIITWVDGLAYIYENQTWSLYVEPEV